MLMDYIEQNSIDPQVILSKFSSYHEFLRNINIRKWNSQMMQQKFMFLIKRNIIWIKKFGLFST